MHTPDIASTRLGLGWAVLLGLWLMLVTWGAARLELFAATPGPGPSAASISAGKRFHLYAFVTPGCPCSTATLHELGRLVSVRKGFDLTVVIDIAGLNAKTSETLTQEASGIPGCAVELDRDGAATNSFGAKTSGQILLYDVAGKLEFDGGITAGRGHEGDNLGMDIVEAALSGQAVTTHRAAVFGCALPVVRRAT